MQRAVTFFFTILLGTAIAAGIAALVHLVFPSVAIAVFILLTVYWLWTGWRYAAMRDRIEEDKGTPFAQVIEQHLAARMNETVESLGATLERAGHTREGPKDILLCVAGDGTSRTLAIVLQQWGYRVTEVSGLAMLIAELKMLPFDLLIADLCHPEIELHSRRSAEAASNGSRPGLRPACARRLAPRLDSRIFSKSPSTPRL